MVIWKGVRDLEERTLIAQEHQQEWLAVASRLVARRPREACSIARAVYDDARERGARGEAARAQHVVGQSLSMLGQLIAAKGVLRKAEVAARDLGDMLTAACCLRDWAIVVYFQGDYPTAASAFRAALDELERHDAPLEAAQCLCWMGFMTSFQQLIAEATVYVEAARALIDPVAAPFEAALCRLLEGMNAQRLTQSEQAEAALADAAASFEAHGERIWFARALTQQGFLWSAHQEFARATKVCERALEILQQCESRHYAAMVVELLGKLATYANDWERACELLDAARAVYAEQAMEVLVAQAGLHRANVDYWLDAWEDAEQGYRAMALTARRYGAYHHIVTSESNLGLLALNRGQHDQALLHTHAALEQAVALHRRDDAARCHRQLGNVYTTLGRWEQAERHFEAAIELMEQLVQPMLVAQTQIEYAECARARGDYAEARRLVDGAHAVLVQYATPLFIAECDYRRARLALEEGDLATAEALARGSYEVQARHESTNEMGRIHVVFGGIAQARGDHEAARREYERAYVLLARPFPDEAVQAAAALGALSDDDAANALMWYQRAVQVAQQARGLVPSEQLAAELARQSAPALREALRLALGLGRDEAALAMAEDARAQVALAWLEGQRRSQQADADWRNLAERCFALRNQIEGAEEATDHEQREQLDVLRAEYDDALAVWRRFGSDAVPGNTQPFSWERCRAQLEQLGVAWQALVYWLDDDQLTIWQCDRDNVQAYERRLSREERHSLELCSDGAGQRRAYLYDRDPATLWTTSPSAVHLGRAARTLLPADLADRLTPDTLLAIVPAGLLHGVPFAVLPLAGKPLVEHATISIAPSLQLLGRLVDRRRAAGEAILAIGVPQHEGRDALPEACAEATMVAASTGGDVWCNADATRARLWEASASGALARYRAIHIATHAWAGVARGEQAGIALADGNMLVTELAQLHLDTDVVVLSACESGTALHHAGEEMIGLTYGLLQAGSRALVASLWKIDDSVSLELMREMYEAQHNGHVGPWALTQMQRRALARGYTPFHWAGYQWIGRPTTDD